MLALAAGASDLKHQYIDIVLSSIVKVILMCYTGVDKSIVRSYVTLGFIFVASVACNKRVV